VTIIVGNGMMVAAVVAEVVLIGAAVGIFALQQPATGTMSIYVKDEAIAWKHLNITFSEVRAHQASEYNDNGWRSLSIKNGDSIELASLTNVSKLLASSAIYAGKYTQIRIVVNSTGMMLDGTHVTFTVPFGELKTTHPFDLHAGDTKKLTLEIDLQRSIINNGSGWTFSQMLGAVSGIYEIVSPWLLHYDLLHLQMN